MRLIKDSVLLEVFTVFMKANLIKSSLFNNISIPEVFLSSILPRLSGDSVKLYLYILYLADKGLSFTQKDLMTSLSFAQDQLNGCLLELESQDLIIKSKDSISINNISEMKLHSIYRPIESLTPSETSNNKERIAAIEKLSPNPEITRFKGLGEISPQEFKGFINEDIRLEEVTLENAHNLKEILRFYMGDNTDDRRQYIVDNLRIEEDLA